MSDRLRSLPPRMNLIMILTIVSESIKPVQSPKLGLQTIVTTFEVATDMSSRSRNVLFTGFHSTHAYSTAYLCKLVAQHIETSGKPLHRRAADLNVQSSELLPETSHCTESQAPSTWTQSLLARLPRGVLSALTLTAFVQREKRVAKILLPAAPFVETLTACAQMPSESQVYRTGDCVAVWPETSAKITRMT
ncbi:hypothetical protein AXG93_3030s1020 [Marchantia polymorpha subsp. ruderalis]|uniref:Uncharacterized protein n=1 Tax=Marchantia polymorpha subsp. ruderalis TaxID=1480154 RepID=A0A176VRC2_MARPO|nr:hypothetical protein AXG93_3030s1020 [Marchantia polymorpha subsp. ruderalis]